MKFDLSAVKEHPVATGIIVIGGGLAFFILTGRLGGGSSSGGTTVIGGPAPAAPGPSDAQVLASAQSSIAGTQAGRDIALGQLQLEGLKLSSDVAMHNADLAAELQSHQSDNELTATIEGLKDSLSAITVQTNGNVQMTQIAQDGNNHLIDAITGLVRGLGSTPAPAPSAPPVTPAYVPFDPFNTSNASQPLFQGYDATIAQEIDAGKIVINNGVATIVGDGNSQGGTFVLTNPLDTRWDNYTKGSYTAGTFGGV